MAIPGNMEITPEAVLTVAVGYTTDPASEFWQRIPGNLFIVYSNVPQEVSQNILQSSDPDTAIRLQLAGYSWRVSS
jgi:hypothetical protein